MTGSYGGHGGWQLTQALEVRAGGAGRRFLEEVVLLTVKNEDVRHIIREERGVCKDVVTDRSGICVGTCRWKAWWAWGRGGGCYRWS